VTPYVVTRKLTNCHGSEAPVPSQLAAYGLKPTYGKAGLLGAQLLYWGLQARDALLDWRRGPRTGFGRA
jgi:hypothetical protein